MLYRTKKEIAKVFNVHPITIGRWITKEAFPASKLPNGEYVITDTLIDQWLLSRAITQREKRIAKRDKIDI